MNFQANSKEYEPYRMLAIAILLSDIDDTSNRVWCVYDMLDHERCVGVFNRRSGVARLFNIKEDSISKALLGGWLVKGRFKIEPVECETTLTKLEFYKAINEERNERFWKGLRRWMS